MSRRDQEDQEVVPPQYTIQMSTTGAVQTLSIDFTRSVTNEELNWFLSEAQNHRFIMKSYSFSTESEAADDDHLRYMLRTRRQQRLMKAQVPGMKRFPVKVQITFHPHILNASQMPAFIRLFCGLDEGELPKAVRAKTVWDWLREPLV
jgi:hypothetical protein